MAAERDPLSDPAELSRAALWRQCMEAAPAGIAMFDRDMRYLAVNRRFCDSLNLPAQSLLGQIHYEVFPEIPQRWRDIHRRCLAGSSESSDADLFVRADGSAEWWRWSIHPWHDATDAIGGIVLFTENVSAGVTAEAERRQLADAFANAAFGMIIGDPVAGTIRFANQAYAAMRGMTVEEIVGTSVNDPYVEDLKRLTELRAIADRRGEVEFNATYRRKDGSIFPARVHVTSVREAGGNIRYRLGSVIDITAQEEIEAKLRQADKMEAVGQLTGGLAHDFNNLLTVVIGNLDTLLEERPGDGLVRDLAGHSVAAAERGAQLTKQLLAFSRRQPLRPQRLHVNAFVAQLTQQIRGTLGSGIAVETVLQPDLWPVHVDPAQLESALMNLAANARDALPDGGRLMVRTRNSRCAEDAVARSADLPRGDYVVIEVEDTGIGIADDVLPHIFEPFYTTKEVGKGTGLGLSMVYGFAKQSGGHVTVESEVGVGTTFSLSFPRVQHEMVEDTQATPQPATSGITVLVVEDDNAVRKVTVAQLVRLGYRAIEANGAAAALSVLEKTHVDVLFSDVVMPGEMNGTELARHARERWPKLRVLLMSGYPGESRDEFGGDGPPLLTKPFRAAQLSRALQQVLEQSA